jgi:peptidoglycan lytic transglycosylase
MNQTRYQRVILLLCCGVWASISAPTARAEETHSSRQGQASWYGEEHRGMLMANGRRFDPDKMTAASWFYPLGTRVRVTVNSPNFEPRSVLVTITDRGPARRLVHEGRVIDLTHAAFQKIAAPDLGLATVVVEPIRSISPGSGSASRLP